MDYYTSDYFFISTTNDLILVRNDMINKPSPLPLSHVGGREYKSPLFEIKDFGPPARGGHFCENELKRNELFTSQYSPILHLSVI